MNCPNCGNKIENNQKFCPSCGRALTIENNNSENNQESKSGLIMIAAIIIIALIVGVGVFLQNRNSDSTSDNNDKKLENSNSVVSNSNTTSNQNTNQSTNTNTNTSTNKNSNTNSNKTPEKLTCTQSLQDRYGTYYATHNYTFKNNQLASYKMVMTANLNKQSYQYRDNIIATYDKAYAQYKAVSGIKISSNKRKDGFDYVVEIVDSKKVDKEKLKSMNLYLINYSGIKMEAYKKGAVCK